MTAKRVRALPVVEKMYGRGRGTFTIAELQAELGVSVSATRNALSRLMAKGEVATPARGFYAVVRPVHRKLGCLPPQDLLPPLMKHWGIKHYYAGLLSAAEHHGAASEIPQAFQVVMERSRPPIVCGAVKIVFIARENVDEIPVERFTSYTGQVPVSTVEATAVDLVGHMGQYTEGVNQVAGMLRKLAEEMNPKRLAEAAKLSTPIWGQRLGYLLEYVGAGDKTALLRYVVRKRARNYTKLLPDEDAADALRSKDWRLWVNTRIYPDA